MTEQPIPQVDNKAQHEAKEEGRATVTALIGAVVTGAQPEGFTRGMFEDAIDRVSRPVKGKYADILPSSEEFIRDKRREIELEDRLS